MAEEVAALTVRLEASVARFEQQMRRAERTLRSSAQQMQRQAETLDGRLERVGERFGIGIPTRAAAAATAVAAIGLALRAVVRNGDELRRLEGRFTALTGSAGRAEGLMRGVFDVAGQTGAAIGDVAAAFARLRIAGDDVGATDAQVARLGESFLKLGQIGGSTTAELSNGMTQFAQGLSSGVLQGDELKSLLEGFPLIADLIAEKLGVARGELKALGSEGKITADVAMAAILDKTEEIDRQFAQLPNTLDRATGRMAAAWSKLTAAIDESTGASELFIRMIEQAAAALDRLGSWQATDVDANLNRLAASAERRALDASITAQKARDGGTGLRQPTIDALEFERAGRAQQAQLGRPPAAPLDLGTIAPTVDPYRPPEGIGAPAARPRDIDFGYNPPARGGGGGGRGGGATATDAEAARLVDSVAERVRALAEERAAIGLTGEALARLTAQQETARMARELDALAAREGTVVTAEQRAEMEALAAQYMVLTQAIAADRAALEAKADAERAAADAAEAHKRAIETVGNALTSAITQADSFEDALKNVAAQLLNLATQGLFGAGPLAGAFGRMGLALPNLGTIGGKSMPPMNTSAEIFGKGAAFRGGRVIPFARGGVVGGPTTFPMAGNAVGLMGEAGPEAILPLRRGPGGKLGVEGGGGVSINVDARGATDPTATAAAVRRAIAGDVREIVRDMRRRGQV